MLGHAEEWLYRGLGGIRLDPASPAFKRFILRPDVPRDLEWVKASYDSIHGRISSQWRQTPDREGSRFTWTVTIPPNTSATVFVPARDLASVHEGSRPASQSPGLKLLRMEHPFAVLEAASGTYQFESEVSGVTGL
jgi:alpha-L-rhamnosidase